MLASSILFLASIGGVDLGVAGPSGLPRSTPSAQGVDAAGVVAFLDAIDAADLEPHGFMLVRHGKVVAQGSWAPYEPQTPHTLYSLSKSFASTAVGLAVAEGRLSVDDAVVKFFPEDLPADVSPNLKAMKVRDLLTMTCGHETEPQIRSVADNNWPKAFLAHPVPHKPGTRFLYNSMGTYMLSAIVQKLTGQTLLDYLRPRLLDPLGVQDGGWESDPRGVNFGGWGLSVTLESIAKFGELYLRQGVWRGKRLIPAAWVTEASRKQVPNGDDPNNDWNQGYGYQFWRTRHNGYRGDGAFGQFCIVLPEKDAVIAITSGHHDMGRVMELAWKHLLPAMGNHPPVASDAVLAKRLASLELRPRGVGRPSDLESAISGTEYRRTEGDPRYGGFSLKFEPKEVVLAYRDDRGERTLRAGRSDWARQISDFDFHVERRVAAKSEWTTATELAIKVCDLGSPRSAVLRIRFEADKATAKVQRNGTFEPGEGPSWVSSRLVQ